MLFKRFMDKRFMEADAGGTGGSTGAEAAPDMNESDPSMAENTPVAEAQAEGEQTEGQERMSFDDLINGDYKDDFQRKIQEVIQDRLKGSRAKDEKIAPILRAMADKYGKDVEDIDGIREAFDGDSKRIEQQALEQGISPEMAKRLAQLKERSAAKRKEQADAQAQADAQKAQAEAESRIQNHYAALKEQEAQMKQLYPGFDLTRELQNEKFFRMTTPEIGLTLEEAYMALHGKEIVAAGMQYAVNRSAAKVAASVQANGRRPSENGIRRAQPVEVRKDPTKFNDMDRREIRRRVAMGEKIVF